jgi:hypothetical protein
MDKAGWHEFLIYALNRPLGFAIIHLAARLGQAAHLPPIGTFVNDAEIAREVLTDTAHFDSHSPGSLGVLLTQALGSYALLKFGREHVERPPFQLPVLRSVHFCHFHMGYPTTRRSLV